MITKTKKKDVFLTKAQLTKLISSGTLEEGVIYHVTDENAGHELALDESVLKLLDSDGNTISQVELPQSGGVETIDLDIVRGTDGTLSSTELEQIKNDNVVFVSARIVSGSATFKMLLTKTQYNKGATTGTILFSSNILGTNSSNFTEYLLQINLSTGAYYWHNAGIAMIQLNAIKYGTDGTLTEEQLENVKDANSYHALIHLSIRGGLEIGYDILVYTDTKAKADEIVFTASGLRPITIDLTTGAYTFGEIEDEVTYATDEDIDGLFGE